MSDRDETTVSRTEHTEVSESHSSDGDVASETHTHSERTEVHEEVPVRPEVSETTTTTTTTVVEE